MSIDIVFDVDGVFNAFPLMGHRSPALGLDLKWGWDCEPTEVECAGFPITYATALVERVNALVDHPDVTPYWLTTWLGGAPAHLCPAIGLNGAQWPVLGAAEYHSVDPRWWKHVAFANHVHDRVLSDIDRRFVWIDDDLAFDHEAKAWVTIQNIERPRILGIAPETHNGLTLHHLDIIEHWIETGKVLP